jgi:hypothetical protein
LSLLQTAADVGQELLALRHGFGDGRHPGVARLIGADRGRVTPVDDAERCLPQ